MTTVYGPAGSPVPIFQHEAEFSALLDLYRERAPAHVLEVGTYHGGTLWHWIREAASGAHIVSLDSYAAGVDNRALCREWAEEAGVDLTLLQGNSNAPETADQVRVHGPFDWVFIDAGHYLGEVTRDWELYAPMCEPGGIAALHDILPPTAAHPEIEVSFLWEKIQRAGYATREIIHDPGAEWGGVGVVYL